jgi:hypothetical protein
MSLLLAHGEMILPLVTTIGAMTALMVMVWLDL